jgi:hypothetical protein
MLLEIISDMWLKCPVAWKFMSLAMGMEEVLTCPSFD